MSLVTLTALNDHPLMTALLTPWLMSALLRVVPGGMLRMQALGEALLNRARQTCEAARSCREAFEGLAQVLTAETWNPTSLTSPLLATQRLMQACARLAIDKYVADNVLNPRVAALATRELRGRMAHSLLTHVTLTGTASLAISEWITEAVPIVAEFTSLRREVREPGVAGLMAPVRAVYTSAPIAAPPPVRSTYDTSAPAASDSYGTPTEIWQELWSHVRRPLSEASPAERRAIEERMLNPRPRQFERMRQTAALLGFAHLTGEGDKRARSPGGDSAPFRRNRGASFRRGGRSN